MEQMTRPRLSVDGLTKSYSGLVAVDDVSITFDENEYTAIIGPNGAGKTTFINLLSGEIQPSRGSIFLGDEEITELTQEDVCQHGIGKSYQIVSIFPDLTVYDNIYTSLQQSTGERLGIFRSRDAYDDIRADIESVLERVHLLEKSDQKAASLSHGEKRRLDIGLTIASGVDILIFDEPLAGLNDSERADILDLFNDLESEYTILIIEHNIEEVLEQVNRVVVMHAGQIIADGTPAEIQEHDRVKEVYLDR